MHYLLEGFELSFLGSVSAARNCRKSMRRFYLYSHNHTVCLRSQMQLEMADTHGAPSGRTGAFRAWPVQVEVEPRSPSSHGNGIDLSAVAVIEIIDQ